MTTTPGGIQAHQKTTFSVLSVAYPLTPVGEDAAGGSEQILTMLDRALTVAGHRSIVIAAEGSAVHGIHIESPGPRGAIDESSRLWARKVHKQLIADTLARYSVDIVHMHSLDFHEYLPGGAHPVLATLHLPPDWYPSSVFRNRRRNLSLNCVSTSQYKACPKSSLMLPPIPNGVDVSRLHVPVPKEKYALALGRICPEKGFHFALDAAKKAGSELLLAGELIPYAAHQQYFREQLVPRLDENRRFIGPVGFTRKRQLLAGARCLLIPSTVQETSSLVAMEALAAGTPVIAFKSGALPEIVEHGRTGFLVSNAREMARAIANVDSLSGEECRRVARQHFSSDRMVESYQKIYRRLIARDAKQESVQRAASGTSWLVNW